MNDHFFVDGGDEDKRQYTMCHEVRISWMVVIYNISGEPILTCSVIFYLNRLVTDLGTIG
jgi:hypothetical protein